MFITHRAWRPVICTTNPTTGREYRLSDDRRRQWFAHYAENGAGFGYLSWTCKRAVGYDWEDLGYGFPVTMRKGPFNVLFSGQIVKISERSGKEDEIEVWALGWVHVTKADTYNWIYCDMRLNRWVSTEDASGSLQPDRFDVSTSDSLYLKPRRSVDFEANDYTYLRYTFPFGELAVRITASYDVAFPNSWPGKAEVRDSDGTVLWSTTTTGTGTIDLLGTGSPINFEVRLYCTAAGESTADDDTVYAKLTNVKVYSVNVTTLDAKVIADDIADYLSVAGHGLSSAKTLIAAPGRDLVPAFFDRDQTPADVLTWCVQFGDSDGNPVVWGVEFDDTKRMFLETVDLTTIKYVVYRDYAELTRSGDWGESSQKVYGIYSDESGTVQRTADRVSQSVIDRLGGYYRRSGLQISGTTDEDRVLEALALWLNENDMPATSGSFSVRHGVHAPEGRFVPFDELTPGNLVQVREWRAVEATLSEQDYRDNVTTFPLAGVKVDEDGQTVELIPRATSDAFARYMAIVQELSQS